jgi:hypothetical protein
MNSRDTRTRYLLRMALSLARPLVEDEDCKDMEALLHELNGDSWSLNHEAICWQMEAAALLREVVGELPSRTSTSPSLTVWNGSTKRRPEGGSRDLD